MYWESEDKFVSNGIPQCMNSAKIIGTPLNAFEDWLWSSFDFAVLEHKASVCQKRALQVRFSFQLKKHSIKLTCMFTLSRTL